MIIIRTDANEYVAMGHLMRCLSIADALKLITSEEIIFCLADKAGHDVVRQRGFEVYGIDGRWDNLDLEIGQMKILLSKNDVSLLIVDSYYVKPLYFKEVSQLTKTVYIDDRNTDKYDCDLLINYSIYASEMGYRSMYDEANLLLGSKYSPLRMQFFDIPKREINPLPSNILILSGGTDKYNFSVNVAKELIVRFPEVNIIIISGALNEHIDDLKKLSRENNKIKVLFNISDIVKYMCFADIAISACGTTIYELCAVGTPIIGYGWTDNHAHDVEKYEDDNLMLWAGDIRDGLERCVKKCIDKVELLMLNNGKRLKMVQNQQKMVSGNGAINIAKKLKERFDLHED